MLTLNLLPPIEKERLRLKKIRNFFLGYLVRFVIVVLIGFSLLLGSYFYISSLASGQNQTLGNISGEKNKDLFNMEKMIKDENKNLKIVMDLEQSFNIKIPVFEEMEKLVISGVYLKNFSWMEPKKIKILGFAPTREEFLSFKEKIEKSHIFSEVYSPISNLLEPRNLNFSLDLKLK